MIPFDFEYYRPDTVGEAVCTFFELDRKGKSPIYYGGGTELISMARVGNLSFGSAVDIKNIPDCKVQGFEADDLWLGSALTLSDITGADYFPLLSKTAGRIADHTMQCKITFGGNLASRIIYRETVLPLLLSDARLTIAGEHGLTEAKISEVFEERLTLPKGEFIVKAAVPKKYLAAPYFHIKKTRSEKIDYPLVTAAGLKTDGLLRIAFSGLARYPFRDAAVETALNDSGLSFSQRADEAVRTLAGRVLSDSNGSAEYRKYVLKYTVENILNTMKDR